MIKVRRSITIKTHGEEGKSTWTELLTKGLLLCAGAIGGCLPITTAYVYNADDDEQQGDNSSDSKKNGTTFIGDSGASSHCCNDATLFTKFHSQHPKMRVRVANGNILPVHAVGDITLRLRDSTGQIRTLQLHNVLYVPKLSVNLISTKKLWKDSHISTAFTDHMQFSTHDGIKFLFPTAGKQYAVYHTCLDA